MLNEKGVHILRGTLMVALLWVLVPCGAWKLMLWLDVDIALGMIITCILLIITPVGTVIALIEGSEKEEELNQLKPKPLKLPATGWTTLRPGNSEELWPSPPHGFLITRKDAVSGRYNSNGNFTCPGCDKDMEWAPEHGALEACPDCNAHWIAFGNSLYILKENPRKSKNDNQFGSGKDCG